MPPAHTLPAPPPRLPRLLRGCSESAPAGPGPVDNPSESSGYARSSADPSPPGRCWARTCRTCGGTAPSGGSRGSSARRRAWRCTAGRASSTSPTRATTASRRGPAKARARPGRSPRTPRLGFRPPFRFRPGSESAQRGIVGGVQTFFSCRAAAASAGRMCRLLSSYPSPMSAPLHRRCGLSRRPPRSVPQSSPPRPHHLGQGPGLTAPEPLLPALGTRTPGRRPDPAPDGPDPGPAARRQILKFGRSDAADLQLVRAVGREGREPSQFRYPLGLCVDEAASLLFVADTGNGSAQAAAAAEGVAKAKARAGRGVLARHRRRGEGFAAGGRRFGSRRARRPRPGGPALPGRPCVSHGPERSLAVSRRSALVCSGFCLSQHPPRRGGARGGGGACLHGRRPPRAAAGSSSASRRRA